MQEYYEQHRDVETILKLLKPSGTNWIVDALPQFERARQAMKSGKRKLLGLGNCPSKEQKWDPDRESVCHTENVFKAYELDAVVVSLDIRKECPREQAANESGKAYDVGFCKPFHEDGIEKLDGVLAMSLEMETAAHSLEVKLDDIVMMGVLYVARDRSPPAYALAVTVAGQRKGSKSDEISENDLSRQLLEGLISPRIKYRRRSHSTVLLRLVQ